MFKEMPPRRMVYIAAGLVIGVTALWAFLFVPRLAVHPQAVAEGVNSSSKMFFAFQLAAAVVLLAVVVLSRYAGTRYAGIMIRGLLYLAAILVFLHDFMVFNGATYYLQTYKGFYAIAILMLACVGVNLVAGILAIMAARRPRPSSSAP
jgi:hypothetical protein